MVMMVITLCVDELTSALPINQVVIEICRD